jgi:hypothetical protein
VHVGTVGIENPGDLDTEIRLAIIIKKERFRTAFALIIA